MSDAGSMYLKALPGQLIRMGIYLAILAVLHFMQWLILMPAIRWTLVGLIVVSAFVPVRFSGIASGVGFLIVAGVSWFGYRQQLVAGLCAVFGVWSLVEGVREFRGRA
ncbi:hypothetical protein PHYC_03545 [Phycisphaerales bacterium]|nr:hypothetical protein PHYC_03545 [Phycisphaerales bacterium]